MNGRSAINGGGGSTIIGIILVIMIMPKDSKEKKYSIFYYKIVFFFQANVKAKNVRPTMETNIKNKSYDLEPVSIYNSSRATDD